MDDGEGEIGEKGEMDEKGVGKLGEVDEMGEMDKDNVVGKGEVKEEKVEEHWLAKRGK